MIQYSIKSLGRKNPRKKTLYGTSASTMSVKFERFQSWTFFSNGFFKQINTSEDRSFVKKALTRQGRFLIYNNFLYFILCCDFQLNRFSIKEYLADILRPFSCKQILRKTFVLRKNRTGYRWHNCPKYRIDNDKRLRLNHYNLSTMGSKVILQYENDKPHRSSFVQQVINELRWKVFPHPAYSPNIVPCDYHLFRSLRTNVESKKVLPRISICRPYRGALS